MSIQTNSYYIMAWASWRRGVNRARASLTRWHLNLIFSLVGAVFLLAVFELFWNLLAHLKKVPLIGAVLAAKLLALVMLTFLMMALFSNIINAIASLYISRDVGDYLVRPLPIGPLISAKFIECYWSSSWMVLVSGLPILLAYGRAFRAPWPYYPLSALALAIFLVVPCAVGMALTALLGFIMPAKRTRDVLIVLGAFAMTGGIVLLRMMRPERLMSPDESLTAFVYLDRMRAGEWTYLPSHWVASYIQSALGGNYAEGALYLSLLAITALAAAALLFLLLRAVFLPGWRRAQEMAGGKPDPPGPSLVMKMRFLPMVTVSQKSCCRKRAVTSRYCASAAWTRSAVCWSRPAAVPTPVSDCGWPPTSPTRMTPN